MAPDGGWFGAGLTGELIAAAVVGAAVLALLALAELMRLRKVPVEWSRKFAHVGAGALVLTFPWLFRSSLTVALLAGGFAGLLALGRLCGGLRSVHAVDRASVGAYVFPLVVAALFHASRGDHLLFQIPIVVLAVSDALAAVIGKLYGGRHFSAMGDRRSLEGSVAFLVSAFFLTHLPLLLSERTGRLEAVLIAANVAALVTAFEAISVRGLDNVFIPCGTYFVLTHMLPLPLAGHLTQLAFIGGVGVAGVIAVRLHLLRVSGAIGLGLAAYATLSLGGLGWFAPALASTAILLAGLLLTRRRADFTPPEISDVAAYAIPAVLLVFAFDFTGADRLFMLFLAALSAGSAILAANFGATLARAGVGQRLRFAAPAGGALVPLSAAAGWGGPPALGGGDAVLCLLGGLAGAGVFAALRGRAASFLCGQCAFVSKFGVHCGALGTHTGQPTWWTHARLVGVAVALGALATAALSSLTR